MIIFGLGSGGDTGTTLDGCGQTITTDGITDGTWASDCQSSVPERGYARYYTFILDQERHITIDLGSTVDPFLYLRRGTDRTGAPMVANDDVEPGVNTNSQVSETLAAGTYTVEATTYAENLTGSFMLSISGLAGTTSPDPDPDRDACSATPITDGVTTGAWTSDCQSRVSGRGYARYYAFTLERQSDVTIDLTSEEDTYLYLRDGEAYSGTPGIFNDDVESGVNLNSRVSSRLGAGTYTIEATTYYTNQAGSFTLTLTVLGSNTGDTDPDPTDLCGETIDQDGTATGHWAAGCESDVQGRGYARYYHFTLEEPGEVTIDLNSSVDTYLYLRAGNARSGSFLHENDDVAPGTDTNSRIEATLAEGAYTIEATTYNAAAIGSFILTVSGLGLGPTESPMVLLGIASVDGVPVPEGTSIAALGGLWQIGST